MRKIFVVLSLGLLLASCAPRPPVEIAPGEVEAKLDWSRSLQDQRIAIEGYINFDNGENGEAIAVGPELRTAPHGGGEKLLKFNAKLGMGRNEIGSATMQTGPMFKNAPSGVPDVVTFDPATMNFHDAQGVAHPISDRVRVIGRVQYGISIDNDPRSPTGQRFTPFLTGVTLEKAKD